MVFFPPNSSHWQVYLLNSSGWLVSPPKGSYQVALQMRLVTSSIVGPWDGVSCSGSLRATLLAEVVAVSMYMMPVVLSLMM